MNMYSDHSHFVLPYRVSSHAFVAENVSCYARLLGASIAKKDIKATVWCLSAYLSSLFPVVGAVRAYVIGPTVHASMIN